MSSNDYQFDIDVDTRFLDDQSAPEEGRYVFAYTIHIRNQGKVPARLLGRHWLITDGNGKEHEVVGEGGLYTMPGGPLKAIGWLAGHLAARGRPLTRGQLITSGATTGIHDILAGQAASVRFSQPGHADVTLELHTVALDSGRPELA